MQSRLVLTTFTVVQDCRFIDIWATSTQGGAIYKVGNFVTSVFDCVFVNCTAKSSGGGMYLSENICNLRSLCFTQCHTRDCVNNYYGNSIAGYCGGSLNFSSSLKCGVEYNAASDSTYYFYASKFFSSGTNCTQCSGYGGASGFFYHGTSVDSYIMYHTIIGGKSNVCQCLYYTNKVNFEYTNIVGVESTYSLWFCQSSTVSVSYCVMYSCIYPSFYAPSSPEFSNSYLDKSVSVPGVTVTLTASYDIPMIDCEESNVITRKTTPRSAKFYFFIFLF